MGARSRSWWLAAGVLSVAGIAAMGGEARADGITFTGDYGSLTGTGNGPVLGVLSLQQQSNDDYEYGWSGWDGTSETWSDSDSQVHKDTTASGYFAQSVGALLDSGIDETNLAVVFQVNVSGQGSDDWLSIKQFDVVFYDADGTELGRVTYEPTDGDRSGTDIDDLTEGVIDTDNGILPGVGQGSSGWLYTIDMSSFLSANPNFWDDENNRVGMQVWRNWDGDSGSDDSGDPNNFTNTNDGSDNFFFTSDEAPPPDVIPLPPAAWMSLLGLGGVGLLRLRRRRRELGQLGS